MFLAQIAFVSLVSRLAEKRAPKEVQKAKGSLEPGEENACFSEKFHLCFRGWQDVDGKSTPFYNDLNLQKKAPELCRGIGAPGCPMMFCESPRRSRFPWYVFTSQNGVTLNKLTIKTFVDWSHGTKG